MSSSVQKVQRQYEKMKDRKFRMNNSTETKVVSKDIRERVEFIDKDMDLKLKTLANIFSGIKDYPEDSSALRPAFAGVRPQFGRLAGDVTRRRDPPQLIYPQSGRPVSYRILRPARPRFEKSRVGLCFRGLHSFAVGSSLIYGDE